jgi:Family of unknown function (DUF5678)
MVVMAPPVTDLGELLKDVPPGAWVAISQDQQRVVAYAAEMRDALSKAKELGEERPIIFRVPQSPASLIV